MNMADAYEALGDTARAGECREAAQKIGGR